MVHLGREADQILRDRRLERVPRDQPTARASGRRRPSISRECGPVRRAQRQHANRSRRVGQSIASPMTTSDTRATVPAATSGRGRRDGPSLAPPDPSIEPPDDRGSGEQHGRELAREGQPAKAGGRPEAAGRPPVRRNRQKRKNIAVVQATSGSSIVDERAVRQQVRAEGEQPGREGHRPGAVEPPAPGRGQRQGRRARSRASRAGRAAGVALMADRVVDQSRAAGAVEEPRGRGPAGASRRSAASPSG